MKGRPILGALSGLFFGIAVAILLMQFGIWPLDILSVIGLPLIGMGLGLLLAFTAPFGSKD